MENDLTKSARRVAVRLRRKAETLKKANFEEVRDALVEAIDYIAMGIEQRTQALNQIEETAETMLRLTNALKEKGVF